MTYRSILVHVDDTETWPLRLQAARLLARDDPLTVQGLYAVADIGQAAAMKNGVMDWFHERAEGAEAAFHAIARKHDINARWHAVRSADPTVLSAQMAANAQAADIAILGQWSVDLDNTTIPLEVVEQVAVGSGRPVLLLPYIARDITLPRRAVVAVNGSAESARAMHDALPLLKGCTTVILIAFIGSDGDREAWRWRALAETLELHGVPVKVMNQKRTDVPISELLLSRCADFAADLLVMGAHGAYEFPRGLRGSVTRSILRHMTVPVLMSH